MAAKKKAAKKKSSAKKAAPKKAPAKKAAKKRKPAAPAPLEAMGGSEPESAPEESAGDSFDDGM